MFLIHIARRFCAIFIVLLFVFDIQGQTKHALLIGVSEYNTSLSDLSEDSWANIHGANDVGLLSATLKKQNFKIRRLCNKEATAKNVRKELKKMMSNVHDGDFVYIHFSSHGQPVEDLNGDEDDGWDEAIIPFDAQKHYREGVYTGENHIVDDELNGYLRAIRTKIGRKGFVYVAIDACHAGSSYRGEEEEDSIFVRGTNKGFSASLKTYAPQIDKRGQIRVEKSPIMADICILEACRSYQVNSEIQEGDTYYGSLSFYINKVLQTMPFERNLSWAERVSKLMNKDIRLVRQNLVIESSL